LAEFEEGLFFGLSSLENRGTFRGLLGFELGSLGVLFISNIGGDFFNMTLVEEATKFVVESKDKEEPKTTFSTFTLL
jgi:hypothetical protein